MTKPPKSSKLPRDMALWDQVSQTVKPLKKRPKRAKGDDVQTPSDKLGDTKRVRTVDMVLPTPAPNALPELSHTHQPGLDKATQKRLKRGQVQIQARIDLHGMTQDFARRALEDFLDRAYYQGLREVLVITGKGTRLDGSVGVLRSQVPNWLNQSPNREMITGFSYAAPKDGGEGALYVRIKRRRL